MHQRLLFILSVLFISGTAMAQNVMTPYDGDRVYDKTRPLGDTLNPIAAGTGVMQKWIHDPNQVGKVGRIPWDQTNFKSYRWNNTSFRVRFPKNYDSTKKYPVVVFLHGAGEAAFNNDPDNTTTINRENQDDLFWGAQLFEQRIKSGEWNGFLLFPQLLIAPDGAGSQWDDNTFPNVNGILDTLTKYNGADPDRVIAMGLSAGGVGAVTYASDYPKRIATVVASSPKEIETMIPYIENFVQIPIWIAAGGTDTGPDPSTAFKSRDSMSVHGTNIYFSFYPVKPHDTWEEQWAETDIYNRHILTTYWNNAEKSQPLLYFQNSQFCSSGPINAKMALTPGFAAYEWQMDNGSGFTTIPGATSYTYTATQPGKYQVHFKHAIDSPWSAWTPSPIVISTKKCAVDTAYAEHFDETPVHYVAFNTMGGNSAYYYQNFYFASTGTGCQNGEVVNSTEVFSQDATGRQGGRFILHNTVANSSCTYNAGDQVWHNPTTVQPLTNYLFTFYMGNQHNFYNSSTTALPAYLTASINGTLLTPVQGVRTLRDGNTSWQKYSYVWNSGYTTTADMAIFDKVTDPTWNDFVLDEISLVKYKAPPMPGAAFNNITLWSKANTITGYDSSPLGLWTNSDVNGYNLQQAAANLQPLFKNNAADNINFNPIVMFTQANNKMMQIDSGYSGSTAHTAVTAYVVAKIPTITQNKNLFLETQSGSGQIKAAISNPGTFSWTAGVNPANTVTTPVNTIERNKPTIWTFSKDDINNTASGNKQDIRKNGIVVASNNNTGTFTGNNSPFTIGTFNAATGTVDANVAEIIYLLDSTITPLTQNRIESYLALKYGTTLGNTITPENYIASDSTTVFWTANTKYQNDIFGIGTDSLSGLVQTQSNSVNSGSGDGTGQSGKGNLVLSTPTELLDKSFVTIGNDAGSLAQQIIITGNPVAVGSTRIIRNWKVFNTGNVGAVAMSFDTTGLGNQAGGATVNQYALMISNSGDDTYTGPVNFFTATGASGNKIFFSGVTFNNGAVFTIITNNINTALPAVWLGFTVKAVNGDALLNWKTGDEINVDHYTVEHSFNGVSFSAIATVTAKNSTGENDYAYTDAGLAPGLHYYRIRRTDKDGDSEYSDIKSIRITTTGANVQIRPNPVVGATLVLAVSLEQSNKTNIQVLAVDGKLLAQENVSLAAGNNLVNINIGSVPPGVYLVRVQLSDEVVTKKFIKQHN